MQCDIIWQGAASTNHMHANIPGGLFFNVIFAVYLEIVKSQDKTESPR